MVKKKRKYKRKSKRKTKKNKKRSTIILVALIILTVLFIGILDFVLKSNKDINDKFPILFKEHVERYSKEYNVDKYLIYSVIKQESNFNETAVSHAGATGLMQITKETFWWLSSKLGDTTTSYEDMLNPEKNIKYGTYFLSYLQNEFKDLSAILSAYNAGINKTHTWLKDQNYSSDGVSLHTIPYSETSNYVKIVTHNYEGYKESYVEKKS